MREVVFEAVEAKAAADIAFVPVENTVDRSRLIRAGYVLCGVMAVFAAYKILSPKDPFQTIARVVLPWAEIARPSRVQITDVQPGDSEIYHGQVIAVSASVSGVDDNDPVMLIFSTADGQTVDRQVPMSLAAGGLRYECQLPPSNRGSGVGSQESGIQQDLTYRIVAGDAESPNYRLTVVAAPTIIVEKLEYQFPAYTKKPRETVPQQGDIHALEGSRVTIHAIANQPIKSARLYFDPEVKGAPPTSEPLAVEGSGAWGTIVLELKADRHTPWHGSYHVRYFNERGQWSEQPILHKIEVVRDLPPEVQILQPQKVRIEVPLDGEQTLEVRGVDPDFGLSRLRLEGKVGGNRLLEVELLDASTGQPPQATVPYAFRPQEHKLAVGDELTYAALAEDNRTSPQTGRPEPNVARTADYTIVIVAPRKAADGAGNPGAEKPMPGEGDPQPGAGEKPMNPQQPDKGQPRQGEQAGGGAQKPTTGQKQPEGPNEKTGGQPQQGGSGGQSQSGEGNKGNTDKSEQSGQPDKSQPQGGQSGQSQSSPDNSGGKTENSSGGQQQGQGSASQGGACRQPGWLAARQ